MFHNSTLDRGYISSLHVFHTASPVLSLVLWDLFSVWWQMKTINNLSFTLLLCCLLPFYISLSLRLSLHLLSSHRSLFRSHSSLEMQMSWNLGRSPGFSFLHLFNTPISNSLHPTLSLLLSPPLFLSSRGDRKERSSVDWLCLQLFQLLLVLSLGPFDPVFSSHCVCVHASHGAFGNVAVSQLKPLSSSIDSVLCVCD